VCEAGTFAPSGGNRQPWFFIAVTEPDRRAWVAERYRTVFHQYIRPAVEAAKDPSYPEAKRRNMQAAIDLADRLHEVLCICSSPGGRGGGIRSCRRCFRPFKTSCWPAAQSDWARR